MLALLIFIAVFSFVVVVHEAGHYLVAKWAKVPVYEFSVGFPGTPVLARPFRIRETEFTIRMLPLGGFVRFDKDGNGDDFFAVSGGRRIAILAAGSAANLVVGAVLTVATMMLHRHLAFGPSVTETLQVLLEMIRQTVTFFMQLADPETLQQATGPVGIAVLAKQAASYGPVVLVGFSGIFSLAVGVMNLLPLPAFDGGHIVVVGCEMLRGKVFDKRVYNALNVVGMVFVLTLTAVVTFNDVVKYIVKG